MSVDPKYRVKNLVAYALTLIKKDDDSTSASCIILYEGGPETLGDLFDTYDVVVTVSDPTGKPERHMQEVPEHHPQAYPVNVLTIDKYSSGVLVCTGSRMQHNCRERIEFALDGTKETAYRVRIVSSKEGQKTVGGITIWETTYMIRHTDM